MYSFLNNIKSYFLRLFFASPSSGEFSWPPEWADFLLKHVTFYRVLSLENKKLFEQCCLLFINTTRIEAGAFDVNDAGRLLVAASAIIPV